MGDGLAKRRNRLNTESEREVLSVVVFRGDVLDSFEAGGQERGLAGSIAPQGDALLDKSGSDAGEDSGEGVILDEQSLDGVAGGGIAGLGVDDRGDGLLLVGRAGQVDVAQAVSVSEDGDLGGLLDVADQVVGASGDDEIDVAVLGEELGDHISGGHELDRRVGDLGLLQGGGDDLGDGDEGLGGFFSAWFAGSVDGGV